MNSSVLIAKIWVFTIIKKTTQSTRSYPMNRFKLSLCLCFLHLILRFSVGSMNLFIMLVIHLELS